MYPQNAYSEFEKKYHRARYHSFYEFLRVIHKSILKRDLRTIDRKV